MKSIIYSRVTVLGLALLCGMADANALALGRARSAVLVGQPLSMAVPIQLGADEDVSALCLDADVFYGDARQDRTRVSVTTSPAAQGQPALVRIVSKVIIDEPVVTVEVRAGCTFKTSRRYVLLADMASTVDSPVVVSAIGALPQPLILAPAASIPTPITTPGTGNVAGAPGKAPKGATRGTKRRASVDKPPVASESSNFNSAPNRRVASGKATQKSRLKLTAIDLSVERDPVLRSTDLLLGLPLEDLAKRAQAIATWRALNATPEEVLRQEARAGAVDADLKILKDVTAKNQQALVSLAGRLEEAQSQRFRNPLVYGLALGLLACLVALVYLFLLLRRRSTAGTSPWWRGEEDSRMGLSQLSEFSDSIQPRSVNTELADGGSRGDSQYVLHDPASDEESVDVDLGFTASQAARLTSRPVKGAATLKVEPSLAAPTKRAAASKHVSAALSSINTREVLDVRQQAEFFITLGQHDDAVHLLEYSINNSIESNPLVYLDLLTVLHTLSRKDEFERYRGAFNALFSGRVPPYAQFSDKGHRLEVYQDVCEHIVGLWPSEAAQDFIEQCLVYSNDGLSQEFDLNAFEDLLTLYGILRRLVIGSESGFVPFSTSKSSVEPGAFSDVGAAGPVEHAGTVPVQVAQAPTSGFDLDLSDGGSNLIEFEQPSLSLAPAKPGN
jgi:hypothetical protein